MKSKMFQLIGTHGVAAAAVLVALWGCSGGSGGLQQLDAAAPGLDTPLSTQNQFGPAERPPLAAESDPVDDLKAMCKTFLDDDKEDEAPQECKDYWAWSNYGHPQYVPAGGVGKGKIYQVEPPPRILDRPVVHQIVVPDPDAENQLLHIEPYPGKVLKGPFEFRTDDD